MFITYRALFNRLDIDLLIHSSFRNTGVKGHREQSLFARKRPISIDLRVQHTELKIALPILLIDGWKAIAISGSHRVVLMGHDNPAAAELTMQHCQSLDPRRRDGYLQSHRCSTGFDKCHHSCAEGIVGSCFILFAIYENVSNSIL